ncbi:hypothetical protein ACFQ5D_09115 [Paenibacillus farraposensis]|uniref:TMhelix containing protein n=1 Tax=Paenibacillus farraposensis TaxID=2807095 RepID=A0ABW4DF24_9BACL|nr:hypothetical protein [Paenibacillus farraposensis]MCC3379920.1 hypothetical protein [Paenibacillus farraposensis]
MIDLFISIYIVVGFTWAQAFIVCQPAEKFYDLVKRHGDNASILVVALVSLAMAALFPIHALYVLYKIVREKRGDKQ